VKEVGLEEKGLGEVEKREALPMMTNTASHYTQQTN
jgi:hypothetical protein